MYKIVCECSVALKAQTYLDPGFQVDLLFKIKHGDGLPNSICVDCKEKVISAFEFKTKAREAEASLKKMVKNEKIESDRTQKEILPMLAVPVISVKVEKPVTDSDGDTDFPVTSPPPPDHNYQNIETNVVKNEINRSSFQCVCGLKLESKDLEKDVTNQSSFQCVCGQSITKDQTQICLKVEFNEETTFCPICDTQLVNSRTLAKHMKEKHGEIIDTEKPIKKKRGRPKKIKSERDNSILGRLARNGFSIKPLQLEDHVCGFCKQGFDKRQSMLKHIVKYHKDSKVYNCKNCNQTYMKRAFYEKHLCCSYNSEQNDAMGNTDAGIIEDLEKPLPLPNLISLKKIFNLDVTLEILEICSICTAVFKTKQEQADHYEREHSEKSRRCAVCFKVFATLYSAERHRKKCQRLDATHKCNTCGILFPFEISLNKHILRFHEGQTVSVKFAQKSADKQFICDTCNRGFSRKELLEKHAIMHMKKETVYECDICNRKFNRKDNMKSHKLIHLPPEERPIKISNHLCLYCGRCFTNSSNLIVHMRRHTGEKPYKCDFCEKGFPRSSDLMCHRRSHTGEKPCVCTICHKAFSRSNKLTRHMRVHTGLKPYKCTYCTKAFSQSNDLTLHIRRHTGDKPYVCEICGERFIQGTALQNHKRTHGHFIPSSSGVMNAHEVVQSQTIKPSATVLRLYQCDNATAI